ncbi:hypothetical protein DXT99_07480 [Pontibacter diazotrophicus]|uniref:STAS/SEC14 domain-containing protein n=1 Tax=Pontibacter diazotrophicus TaxID=1400979 RepID=A0A3D8LFY9_9BACT|nr:hypothetical protein [Pontibacter diazotrophicus]RDV15832.1 hypothetical protein DXT99_07480 [Pontibacter diazotrophicus]
MIIYSGIVTLDYNPETGILTTTMPNVHEFGTEDVSFCLGLIIESIINYDIKKLLLDSSESVMEVEDEAYKAITLKFGIDMRETCLKKIARISTTDTEREKQADKLSAELRLELNLPLEFKSFANRDEAMVWLLS